jgi:hypothetical protein
MNFAVITPEQLCGHVGEFVARCRAEGQAWFEATVAAQTPTFSLYIGERLGWRTDGAIEALSTDVMTLLGRIGLAFRASGAGPYAEDAKRLLAET